MSPEDLLLHQFIHNANHSFDVPLHSILDSARIAARLSPDWDQVVALAREWDATAAAYLTLHLARTLAHAPVPEAALSALRPSWLRERWLRHFILERPVNRDGDGVLRFPRHGWHMRLQQAAVGLPLLDGHANRLRFLAHYARLRLRDLIASR